ncbi:MAG TPA: hypothetical protein VHB27_09515, partial [Rhodopila sp.]|uniref:hypothetical protein n=1 Tax=Rhodopila sp. TaxID=2480087 RepID=UPI002C86D7F7
MSGNAPAALESETSAEVRSLQEDGQAKGQFVGYIDESNRFFVTGWVADRSDWSRSLRVDVLVNGVPVGYCEANLPREGLKSLDPNATGRYVYRYYYANPLSMFEANHVTVRVSSTKAYLIETKGVIPAVSLDRSDVAQRPLGPVLLSTCGRTGSTAVMSEMARHPHIIVAGKRPFEIELGCYYAYALRTLCAATDTERSLRADRITATENRFHIGFNPYFDHALAPTVFKNPLKLSEFLYERVPSHLAKAFRNIILDFYQEVAADKGISYPIYFAEKSLPERDSRLGIRYLFPNVREVVLVRDF